MWSRNVNEVGISKQNQQYLTGKNLYKYFLLYRKVENVMITEGTIFRNGMKRIILYWCHVTCIKLSEMHTRVQSET